MFTSAQEAILWIENIKRLSPRSSLDRMRKCLGYLGNPEKKLKIVHIAGTNGKGSVLSSLASILSNVGYKVGRFISPYVISFNERIAIDDEFISDDELVEYANIVYDISTRIHNEEHDVVTFFEVITLIGLLYFADKEVAYALLEVGLGGLLDATNVVYADLSLITNIGFDHMSVLGNSLDEIATQKLGIVKPGNHLLTTVDASLRNKFKEYCSDVQAEVTFISADLLLSDLSGTVLEYAGFIYKTPLIGVHQKENTALAIAAAYFLLPDLHVDQVNEGLKTVKWPGRMDVLCNDPLVIVDGAHNLPGIQALVSSIEVLFKGRNIHFIFAVMKDKEAVKMIAELESVAKSISLTQIDYHRAKESVELQTELSGHQAFANLQEAFESVRAGAMKDDVIIFTGSLYFASKVIKYFRE